MKRLHIITSYIIAAAFCHNLAGATDHKVKIEEQEIHLKRDKNARPADATSFIDEVDIVLPKIHGMQDKQIEEKINKHLTLQNLYEMSLDDIKDDFQKGQCNIETLSYQVNYMDEKLLDIDVLMETSAAYPDTHHAHRLINLKTGDLVQLKDVFRENKLESLVDLIKKKKENEEKKDIDRFSTKEELESYKQILENAPSYSIKDLENFEITDKGIKFMYNYGASHAERALEPAAYFELSFDELQPFLKPDGLLNKFVR